MQLKWPMLWDLFSLFPAHAGVIPMTNPHYHAPQAFPRIRGGDPPQAAHDLDKARFSPHTRG